jgi:PAS domain-containing protein
MILAIILGVLVLIFGFVAYMVSKSWRWPHVTLFTLIFLTTLGAMILASAVLKTHAGWRAGYNKLTKELATTESRLEELKLANALDEDADSVSRLQGDLARLIIDRGRVWRNVLPVLGDGTVDLNMARWGDSPCKMVGQEEDEFDEPEPIAVEPAEGEEGAAQPSAPIKNHAITPGMVVHAFLEVPISQMNEAQRAAFFQAREDHNLVELDTKNMCRVPGAFLGSFRAVQIGDQGITVEPIDTPTESQAALMGQGSWVLYEVLPRDSHDTLAGMSAESIRSLFDFATAVTQADEEIQAGVQESLQEFIRDRTPAEVNDPPERTVVRVKFLKDHSIDVDVDEAEAGIEQGKFDPRGRAQVAELFHGGEVEFKAGDTNYFDAETAERLRSNGIAEIDKESGDVFTKYERELRDFTYLFTERNSQLREIDSQLAVLLDQQRAITEANQNAKEQIAYREQELEKLGDDLANFEKEVQAITKLKNELAANRTKQLQTLSYLYHSNLQLRGLE